MPNSAQEPVKANDILIRNLSEYRNSQVINNTPENQLFNATLEKWRELEPDEEKLKYFIFNCQYSDLIEGNDFEYTREASMKRTDNSALSTSFTENELNALAQKVAFLLLICDDVFDVAYPYKIKNNHNFNELEFYNLKEKDVVADIGTGQGNFSLLLHLSKNDIKVYSSEIRDELLHFNKSQIANYINDPDSFVLVKGNKKSLNLPEKVDKIILRNTYHHFKKKKKMMKAIRASLKPGGQLLMKESLRSFSEKDCDQRLSEQELKKEIRKFGFLIAEELMMDHTLYLKLIPQEMGN